MSSTSQFDEVLDAAERLPIDAQEELVSILRKRLAAHGRQRILADILESRRDFEEGKCRPMTPDEIMREIQS
jgi:hypothetical protein